MQLKPVRFAFPLVMIHMFLGVVIFQNLKFRLVPKADKMENTCNPITGGQRQALESEADLRSP